jgi:hypothetical protein
MDENSLLWDPSLVSRTEEITYGIINILDITAGGVNFNKTCPVPWP